MAGVVQLGCPGHPRTARQVVPFPWMPGTRPGMTINEPETPERILAPPKSCGVAALLHAY
jgi:hypothetical protein